MKEGRFVYSMVVGVLKCFRMSKTQDVVETHALRTHVFLALASLVSLRTLTIPVNTSFGAAVRGGVSSCTILEGGEEQRMQGDTNCDVRELYCGNV